MWGCLGEGGSVDIPRRERARIEPPKACKDNAQRGIQTEDPNSVELCHVNSRRESTSPGTDTGRQRAAEGGVAVRRSRENPREEG